MASSSEHRKKIKVKITNAEIYNSFIKIKAQVVDSDEYIALLDLKSLYKSAIESDEEVMLGERLYIARLNFNDYCRCRVVGLDEYSRIASIDLIDIGMKIDINCSSIRALPKSESVYSIPPICQDFILAELIVSKEYDDYQPKFSKFNELVVNKFFDMEILSQNSAGKFVHLYSLEASITHDIIPYHPSLNTLLKRINIGVQENLLLEQFFNDPSKKEESFSKKSLKNLRNYTAADEFPLGVKCDVRISAYENGPKNFYVQSIKSLQDYQDFHLSLQKVTLQACKSCPKELEVYLGFIESNNVKRVQIIKINGDIVTARLIDHGNKRVFSVRDIYEMPTDVKYQRPFAWKFSLYEIEKLSYMNLSEVNFYFQYITCHKRLILCNQNVTDDINECSLFHETENIFEKLKKYNPQALYYPPKLVPSFDPQKVKIVNAESPKLFYVNLCESLDAHKSFFEEFSKFNPCYYLNPAVNTACCVKINNKNCRGRFEKKLSQNILQVKLIDIGIIEDFSFRDVKVMVKKFTSLPPLAYKCCLEEFKNFEIDKNTSNAFMVKCKMNQTFNMKLHRREDDLLYVTLEDETGNNIADELLSLSVSVSIALDVDENEQITEKCDYIFKANELSAIDVRASVSIQDWSSDERKDHSDRDFWNDTEELKREDFNYAGIVTSVISPNDFTLQCTDSLPQIKIISDELQKTSEEEPLTDFVRGTMCKAINPFTGKWCRGILIESSINEKESLVVIRDVDNGFTFSTDNLSELKKLPFVSLMKPVYGIRCKLPIQINRGCEDEATRIFSDTIGKEMRYKILGISKYYNVCDIMCDKINITDKLVNLDLGKKLKIVPNGIAFIVYVENLNEFYVQLLHETVLLRNIQRYTSSYDETCLRVPMNGMRVMSYNKEYKAWFRAKIISIDGSNILVKYIDFGNKEIREKADLGMINDPSIAMLPPLAHRCSLNLEKGYDPQSPEAIEVFRKIANKGRDEVVLRMVEAKMHHSIVEVYNPREEKNIIIDLLPLCRKIDVEESFLNEELESKSCNSSQNSVFQNY